MLCLSSGKIVDLSTDRAKYHALRNQGPGPDAHHQALYALVDVVYRYRNAEGNPQRGWTEYDYYFSGHTLADIRFAADWSESDVAQLFHWVKQKTQYLLIENARRRLIADQHKISVKLNSAPDFFYSLLQQRIKNQPMQSATVKQWRATIQNMKQKGLREEEIQWSGLTRYLLEQNPQTRLSKAQLLAAVDFRHTRLELSTEQIWSANGNLRFKEVARRMPHQAVYRAALKLDDSCHCVLRYVDEDYNYRVGVVKTLGHQHHMALNKFWFALDPYGRAISNANGSGLFFPSSESAIAAANQRAHDSLGDRNGVKFHTRYDHLTLYGGTDYREWIVSLPDHQRIFFGAHYFDHNVLAHVRTTTRKDHQGRKLLFIEEMQSDWHQSGARQGYDNHYWGKVANAPFKKEWPALVIKLMLIRASQNGFDGVTWPTGTIHEVRYGKTLNTIKRYYDNEIPKALNKLGKHFGTQVETTLIATRDPWLNLVKKQDKWRVEDGQGKFQTRAKYASREEAMQVLTRHCRAIDLQTPVFFINEALRWQISEQGLPLYGETLD